MMNLKKAEKCFFKGFFLMFFAAIVSNAGFILVYSIMRKASISLCDDIWSWQANNFMAIYGDKDFEFDLIEFFREKEDPFLCEVSNQGGVFSKLLIKYPEMREAYFGAIVAGILDSRTRYFNKVRLIGILEENTGMQFHETPDDIEYDNWKPYTQKAIQNVADWWTNRLRMNAAASIVTAGKDYKYPSPPR